jgi:hypothetical protein
MDYNSQLLIQILQVRKLSFNHKPAFIKKLNYHFVRFNFINFFYVFYRLYAYYRVKIKESTLSHATLSL